MSHRYLVWWVTAQSKRLGVWGMIALIMLIVCAFIYWVKVPAIQADIQQAKQAQAERDKAQADKVMQQSLNPEKQAAKDAASFYQRFPTIKGIPQVMAALHRLAKQHRITLEVGDYRYQKSKVRRGEHGNVLTQYKMVFPVEGRYTDIRTFIEAALANKPELALQDLQVVREDRHTSVVMARIVFAVFVKDTV